MFTARTSFSRLPFRQFRVNVKCTCPSANTPGYVFPSPGLQALHYGRGTREAAGRHVRHPQGRKAPPTLPVCANEDDLKFLACLLDLPVGLHQDPGEASAGGALKDKIGIL